MRKGYYSVIASLATSLLLVILFYLLAALKALYSSVDIVGGVIYVFILSIIVSASIWPGIIKKLMGGERNGGD